jgi:hypothetical protein
VAPAGAEIRGGRRSAEVRSRGRLLRLPRGLAPERAILDRLEEDFPGDADRRSRYQRALFELVTNVLLLPDDARPDHYHNRTERVEMTRDGPVQVQSSSFAGLPPGERAAMWELHVHFVGFIE